MRGAKPESAIEQAVLREGIVRRGERVVVACSGGADSVALAAILASVAKPMDLEPTLAYVHHGTRDSAWQDECVVLRLAASLELPVKIGRLAPEKTSEESLRYERYRAIGDIARTCGASVVATAHHAEDQSETVLLALLRGTGAAGIAGMPARRSLESGIDVVRPLLRISARELRYYCHVRALPYAVDPGNADLGLRRNAVRSALEALRPLFPGLDQAIARTAEIASEELARSERAALRRNLRSTLAAEGDLRDIDFAHIEAAVRTVERGGSGRFHMRPGLELEVRQGAIRAAKREP